ncbi:MAG TPA: phenylalanine--tRNA ligase subunit beta [Candidatus Alectryocaccomicrobium excrementavium]|uniref:Phenylalanine--tRNA ligase beta subunit n=1 Tax=Candidatus Alectryocaccomicrobium excrementavium TaxID=2840668 RepID=A0A9D1K741_9FIRM|nr:phenylalanine--tRNA ligase subunit beta [Candidatus Alectryocaccomicrobium excrementavium]
MKVPMKWLREYTHIALDAQDYAQKMVMSGTGVEGVEKTGADFSNVVVGRVVKMERHPNSDHLWICQVDAGEPLQIVTGAQNVHEGDYVPVAREGAHLPGGVKIKRGKLRGVESCGMLCSGPELNVPEGLYPHCGNEGILIFAEPHTPGEDVKPIFGLGDDIVDFEILANRPDCLSVWGLARESASVLGECFNLPEISVREDGEGTFDDYAKVEVLDTENCPRYAARVITDVKIAPSPMWMREYLYGAGVRPINNIVDITNFIMLETGHPMHAFDLDKVREQTIVVRRAREGEHLTTLDGKEHVLNGSMLVIADKENATGLAGIMGGEESEITEGTRRVLFECAAFERGNNRVTSRTLGIRTESSARFEKGVCPETAMQALDRACMLVNLLDCGRVVPQAFDKYPHPAPVRTITASASRMARLISVPVPAEKMQEILNGLHIATERDGDTLTCVVPPYRQDIEREADLAEEVLRLYGYEHIPSTLMRGETLAGHRSPRQLVLDKVKRTLVDMGMYEAYTYSFISPKWIENLGLKAGDERLNAVKIRNPLGEDTSQMRTSLVPSMLSTLAMNLHRGNAEARMFETAPIFLPRQAGELPEERLSLCIGMYGEAVDFFALKQAVEELLFVFGVSLKIEKGADGYYHPGRSAHYGTIAQLGEIHPDVAEKFEIPRRVYVAEVNLAELGAQETPVGAVHELPRFPAVTRDIALVVEEAVPAGDLLDAIVSAGGKHLEEARLFDLYRGERLGLGKKSLAFALSFRASDRTLTDEEIAASMEKIQAACAGLGAQLRK